MTDPVADAIAAALAARDSNDVELPGQHVHHVIGDGRMEINWYRVLQRLAKRASVAITPTQLQAALQSYAGSAATDAATPPVEDYVPPGDAVLDGGRPGNTGATPDPATGGDVSIDLVNPGFESDLTGWEEGTAYPVEASTWAVITDAPNAHGGSKFLRWTGDSTPLGGGSPLNTLTYYNTTNADSPGLDYLIVYVWARCKRAAAGGVGLTRARVGIAKYDASGTQISTTVSGAVSLLGSALDSGWKQISTFTAKSDDVAYFRVYVEAQGPSGSVVEFDDLTWNGTAP